MPAKKIQSIWHRTVELDRAAVNEEARTIDLSFSSEYPVERYFGVEVLDHSEGCCDLSRLNAGAPLLVNHRTDQQCGVVEMAAVKDKRGVATVRFGKSAFADEIFEDVKTGIRRLVSVGYRLTDTKKVVMEEKDGKETYRFQRWQPYEISIVPVPADPTVGTDRSGENTNNNNADFELPMKRNLLLDAAPAIEQPGTGARTETPNVNNAPEAVIKRERERTAELLKLGAQYRTRVNDAIDLANSAVEKGTSVQEFRNLILDRMSTAPLPNGDQKPGDGSSAGKPSDENKHRSLGELITSSEQYRKLTADYRKRLGESKWARSIDLPDVNFRSTLTTTVAGLTKYERPPGVVLAEQQVLHVADLFAQGTTENTTIRYMREDTYTNAADTLAEEGTYAEASWDLSEQDAGIKKIGVIGRVTDEIFEDSAAVESYVNARLPFMVSEREEIQLLNGTGVGSQQTGIFNTTGIQTFATAAAASVVDAIHKAITKVRTVGRFQPDCICLNPYDWENIKLTKDANGQYLAGGPFTGAYGIGGYSNVMMLWGIPCVSSTNVTQGTALVGAFKLGGQVWRRKGITIETSNSDASDFANGRIAIRVTERIGLAVYRPLAFCSVTGIPA